MSLFLTLLAALAALHAHGTLRTLPRPGLRTALRAFVVGSLATAAALALAARGALAPVRDPLLALAAAAAMVSWAGLIRLVSFETRGYDLAGRWLSLGLAALGVAFGWAGGLIAAFALSGVMAWRWNRELSTRARFAYGMVALFLGLMLLQHTGYRLGPDATKTATTLHRFARAVLITATWYALFGSLVLFRAWVRDPSLGIRRVSRRLALSHVLVGLVPVLLIGGAWTLTTVLGVLNERAIVGARALVAQGRWHRALLEAALRQPENAAPRLGALLTAADPSVDVRVWHRSAGPLVRVVGAPVDGEPFLAGWLDSLATLPDYGVVTLGDSVFLGAAAAGPGGQAVFLAPMGQALRSVTDSVARAELSVARQAFHIEPEGITVSSDTSAADTTGREHSATAGDSVELERIRKVTRRLGLRDSRVTLGRGTSPHGTSVTTSQGKIRTSQSVNEFLLQGHATAAGLQREGQRWRAAEYMITARAGWREVLWGLVRDVKMNPLGLVPLILVGMFVSFALLVAIWDLLMVRGMGRSINQAVGALSGAASKLSAGDLSHRITIAGKDDLWEVAAALNAATEGLARAREMEKDQQRIEDELDVARRIQERLLPAGAPRVKGLEIAGFYDPAREIGGDYYDHIALDVHRVLLVIADVSGKSVPAALIMAGFRAALVSQNLSKTDMPALAGRLNGFLNESLDPGKFVTAFLAIVDGASGEVVYVNAGHNPPVLLRADGRHEKLEHGGTILGIMPGSHYERGETTLSPGDMLVLYTDGVTEATSESSELWGDERLILTLRARFSEACDALVRSIAHEVRAFEGDRGPTDDVTLIAVRRTAG
jgi:serine phosphatase RsbU (regulator of sigma subunit)